MKLISILFCFSLILSCTIEKSERGTPKSLRLEKVNYYKYPKSPGQSPFKYRLTYYFDNGVPHRWVELDSLKQVETEYIYEYNDTGLQIGAKYREEGVNEYSIEKVSFLDETTKVTEWLDSLGAVYYTMTDYLDEKGNTFRAEFKGNKVHGYDSTFYTKEGFPQRIFFTNVKGKVFNDRNFEYDSLNTHGDWIIRKKIMYDTIRELQIREVYYGKNFTTADSTFYPNILSTPNRSQNVFSFTKDQKTLLLTETDNWDLQSGKLYAEINGLFVESEIPQSLDSIYNCAISPSGKRLIINKKTDGIETNWLIEKQDDQWTEPINISEGSNLVGGYFHWHTDTELFFYTDTGNGDIFQGKLTNGKLEITDTLDQLNTENATEFSPFVDVQKTYLIFTRYLEGQPSQQGFFISYNAGSYENPRWETPQKIEALPYGWNAQIINNSTQFLFTICFFADNQSIP